MIELLEKSGFKKVGSQWMTPDGKAFTIKVTVEGEGRPVMTRAGSMVAQLWRQFGIDASTVVAQGTLGDRRAPGDFDAMTVARVAIFRAIPAVEDDPWRIDRRPQVAAMNSIDKRRAKAADLLRGLQRLNLTGEGFADLIIGIERQHPGRNNP